MVRSWYGTKAAFNGPPTELFSVSTEHFSISKEPFIVIRSVDSIPMPLAAVVVYFISLRIFTTENAKI